jgi:hypothetical protein
MYASSPAICNDQLRRHVLILLSISSSGYLFAFNLAKVATSLLFTQLMNIPSSMVNVTFFIRMGSSMASIMNE